MSRAWTHVNIDIWQLMFGFHINNYYKPYYNLLLPYIHKLTLHMVENDKNHVFHGNFLALFWVFWWFYPCQYGSIWYNFCFTHTDNHYKLYYKLLTPYTYLILTLYIVRNDNKITFSMCSDGGAKTSCQRVLWTDGSASYQQMGLQSLFPLLPRQITECSTSEHRGLDPGQLILIVGHGWVVL